MLDAVLPSRSSTDNQQLADHVFAACAILGYRFAPRIRDLPNGSTRSIRRPPGAPATLIAKVDPTIVVLDTAIGRDSWRARRHHCCRDRRAKPDSAETRLLSAAERARDSPAGSRSRQARLFIMTGSGCRTPTACPDRAQQRRSRHALKRAISFHRRGGDERPFPRPH